MKKLIRALLMVFGSLAMFLLSTLFIGFLISGIWLPKTTYADAEGYYTKHTTSLSTVAEYLSDTQYASIHLPIDLKEDGIMHISSGYNVQIDDQQVLEAIHQLNRRGCTAINKSKNAITFQLSGGRGLAYSLDGNTPHSDYITDCQLIEGNWYYYEDEDN